MIVIYIAGNNDHYNSKIIDGNNDHADHHHHDHCERRK